MSTPTTYFAVFREGHVPIDADGNGVVSITSIWATLEEAEYALNRAWSRNFGTWTAKRSWIEELEEVRADELSNLAHNAPELSEAGNWFDR